MGIQNTLKALSDPVRREILNMLKSGQMSAGEITEKFDITGAAISRHLSLLKEADLVRDKKDGRVILVRLTEQGMAKANSLHESAQRAVSTIIREVGREKILTFIRLSEEIDAVVKRTCPTPPEI